MRQHLAHHARQRGGGDVLAGEPPRTVGCRGGFRQARGPHHELQRKMREHMGHHARQAPPARRAAPAAAPRPGAASLSASAPSKSGRHSLVGTSVMPPSRPLAARRRTSTWPSARTATYAAPRRRRPSRFFLLRGNVSASPRAAGGAAVHEGTQRAGRRLRGADGGAKVHQALREIARAAVRHKPGREGANRRLGVRQFVLDREQARHHPLHIAVDRACLAVERDRRHGGRRIGADAGQGQRGPLPIVGKMPPWRATTAWAQAWRLRARA